MYCTWDLDVENPELNPAIQWVLALSDAGEKDDTFVCIPGSHKPILECHAAGRPSECPTQEECMAGRTMVHVRLPAGDIVCWTMALLHGNGANQGARPRPGAYVHLEPVGTLRGNTVGLEKEAYVHRIDVIESWQLAGWQQGLAAIAGSTEQEIEAWTSDSFEAGYLQPLPEAKRETPLSGAQREQVNQHLARMQAPSPTEYCDGIGRGANRMLASYRLCQRAALAIRNLSGIDVKPAPAAELTPLGRRIVGVDPWPEENG